MLRYKACPIVARVSHPRTAGRKPNARSRGRRALGKEGMGFPRGIQGGICDRTAEPGRTPENRATGGRAVSRAVSRAASFYRSGALAVRQIQRLPRCELV